MNIIATSPNRRFWIESQFESIKRVTLSGLMTGEPGRAKAVAPLAIFPLFTAGPKAPVGLFCLFGPLGIAQLSYSDLVTLPHLGRRCADRLVVVAASDV